MIPRTTLTASRKSQTSVGADGRVVLGTPSLITVKCSVQPADKEQLESNPFLRDFKQLYTLYSDVPLQVSQGGSEECDTIVINGTVFDVLTCEFWQNKIRPHYKITVGR